MPFSDVVGSADNVAPEHIAATGLNVDVTVGSIVTDVVAVTAGQPPLAATIYDTIYVPGVLVFGIMAPVRLLIERLGKALYPPPVNIPVPVNVTGCAIEIELQKGPA